MVPIWVKMRWPVAMLVAMSCAKSAPPPEPSWQPGTVYRTERAANARGFVDRRGLIHSHSTHSHDACDNEPRDDAGVYDAQCEADFREGLCKSGHDFAFLSDHQATFDEIEFPETFYFRPDAGDVAIDHGAGPVASRMSCGSGAPAPLLLPGNESDLMPLGLERHADGRGATYGADDAASVQKIHEAGGLAVMAHTEKWNAQQLIAMQVDGFEMYNLHANSFKNLPLVGDWALKAGAGEYDAMPDPNLLLLGFQLEDPAYVTTWGAALASGTRFVTTMGTDCHRNALPELASDGERLDSYRRFMEMFSNHLLVRPLADGSVDDRALKEALAKGRLYGVFEFMGYAQGFDYVARVGASELHEMGEEVSAGAQLEVTMPKVQQLGADADAPVLTIHLLRAKADGWEDVAQSSEAKLTYLAMQPGAYRAEVRMVPRHLKTWALKRQDLIKGERPWVYSNAIYVK